MPSLEKPHPLDAFAPKRAITTTRVADRFAGHLVAYPVRNPRRGPAQPTVAPGPGGHAAPADAVGPRQRFEQPRDLRWGILHVGIDCHQDAAARRLDARP